jgi:hypothetical protein
MCLGLGGCASDAKRADINQTLLMMDQTTAQMKNLKEKITSSTEKMTSDKELDLTEATRICEQLKDFCNKEVQRQALAMQGLKVSEPEKETFKAEFQGKLTQKAKDQIKERDELDAAVKNLEKTASTATFKDETKKREAAEAIKSLKEKMAAFIAEFESLTRKS